MDEKSGKPHFLLKFKKLDFTETTKNFEQNINISKGIGSFSNETWSIYCCYHLLDPPKAIVLKA